MIQKKVDLGGAGGLDTFEMVSTEPMCGGVTVVVCNTTTS